MTIHIGAQPGEEADDDTFVGSGERTAGDGEQQHDVDHSATDGEHRSHGGLHDQPSEEDDREPHLVRDHARGTGVSAARPATDAVPKSSAVIGTMLVAAAANVGAALDTGSA